jgi:hypothetical protein
MSPLGTTLSALVGLALAAASLLFWSRVMRNDTWFRAGVERRFGVTITMYRGHWRVISARHSWLVRLGIELLQLVYFIGAFLVWALCLLVGLGALSLLQRL